MDSDSEIGWQVWLVNSMGVFFRRLPFWIFLCALLARAIPVLLTANMGIGLDDMFQYDMLGRSLASGNGYRWYAEPDLDLVLRYIDVDLEGIAYDRRGVETTFRAPMYPFFLGTVYLLTGPESPDRFFVARLIQAILGALLAPMVYELARKLDPSRERTAALAGFVAAFYPMLVLLPLALATENLFFLFSLWSLLLLLKAGGKERATDYALAGAVLGLALLTRSVLAFFLPAAAWWIWRRAGSPKGAILFCAAACLIVFPWSLRNSLLSGKPSFVESSMGYNLYLGYHPQGTGTFQFGISLDLLTILDDGERDRAGTEKALEFIRSDPGRVPYLILRKAGYFTGLERRILTYFYTNNFFGYIPPPLLAVAAGVFLLPFVWMAPTALLGASALSRSPENLLAGLFAGTYIAPHLLIMADERLHLALIPLLSAWAAAAWMHRKEIAGTLRSPAGWRRYGISVALAILLISYWCVELAADAQQLAVIFGPEGNTARFPY